VSGVVGPLDGPVFPLFLNHAEVMALEVATELLLLLDTDALSDRSQSRIQMLFADRPEGMSRFARLRESAEVRAPILRSLATALAELAMQLERTSADENDGGHD
jgi:hypothetical protein